VQKTDSDQNGVWNVNKAEGQTLKPAAIYLPSPAFPHGQLSVALNCYSSFINVAVENIEDYRQRIEKDRLITSRYIEKCCRFYKKYTNICSLSVLFFFVHEI
jgi:hypothetical protein